MRTAYAELPETFLGKRAGSTPPEPDRQATPALPPRRGSPSVSGRGGGETPLATAPPPTETPTPGRHVPDTASSSALYANASQAHGRPTAAPRRPPCPAGPSRIAGPLAELHGMVITPGAPAAPAPAEVIHSSRNVFHAVTQRRKVVSPNVEGATDESRGTDRDGRPRPR
ncbi:hypothetical protein GCM10009546_69660 [Actinomadura livida]|uniref:Uncharacterized protein n=1 Tax=Actinomadura livida TaxID=79909 RepID=A0ABP3QXM1_9ACTN|nr:hypothetical protein GCM10010208_73560 [Actinomadura livida]